MLVAEQNLVGVQRTSPREEEARRLARSRMRDLEFAWATLLTRGMEQGAIPQADPRLLARAILGLYNSVWHWYRPKGSMSLEEVRDFYVPRCLAIAGVSPVDGKKVKSQAPRRRARRAAAERRYSRAGASGALELEQHGRRPADDVPADPAVGVEPDRGDEGRDRRSVLAGLAEHHLDVPVEPSSARTWCVQVGAPRWAM